MAVILRTSAIISGTALPGGGLSTLYWLPGSAGGSTADATDCLARFRTVFDGLKSHVSTGITWSFDQTVLAIEATTGVLVTTFTGAAALSVTGTAAGDGLPRQTQGLIRWGTATVIAGRRLRGRLYVPAPPEADNDATGVPSSTYKNDVTTAAATIFIAGATSSEACIWHRPVGGGGGSNGDITSATTSATWSVLVSRRS